MNRREKEKLLSVKKVIEKIDKSCRMGDDELIHLAGKDKCCAMMCYLSVRRFRREPSEEGLAVFNRERTVTCSLLNATTGNV